MEELLLEMVISIVWLVVLVHVSQMNNVRRQKISVLDLGMRLQTSRDSQILIWGLASRCLDLPLEIFIHADPAAGISPAHGNNIILSVLASLSLQ